MVVTVGVCLPGQAAKVPSMEDLQAGIPGNCDLP